MNRLAYLAFGFMGLAFLLNSCGTDGGQSQSEDGFSIEGKSINLAAGTKVFLDLVDGGRTPNVIDTASVGEDGSFRLDGVWDGDPQLARVRAGRVGVMMALDNTQQLNLSIDGNNPRNYELTGSHEAAVMTDLIKKLQSRQAPPEYIKGLVDTVKNPIIGYIALVNLKADEHMPAYEEFSRSFSSQYPDHKLAQALEKNIVTTKASIAANRKTAVGAVAPEINLPDPDGRDIPLSSLKGKVVLIDFWASWCGPCRRENPKVVAAYKKYKNKGFEIYSVSLDRSKDRWLKAIEKDGLLWDAHVSDLKYWGSAPAADYGVKSIPQTFLIDGEGKIIAKNLRGSALDNKLQEIFKEV